MNNSSSTPESPDLDPKAVAMALPQAVKSAVLDFYLKGPPDVRIARAGLRMHETIQRENADMMGRIKEIERSHEAKLYEEIKERMTQILEAEHLLKPITAMPGRNDPLFRRMAFVEMWENIKNWLKAVEQEDHNDTWWEQTREAAWKVLKLESDRDGYFLCKEFENDIWECSASFVEILDNWMDCLGHARELTRKWWEKKNPQH